MSSKQPHNIMHNAVSSLVKIQQQACPDPAEAIKAATVRADAEITLARLGADIPVELRNQVLGKIKSEGKTSREVMAKWAEDYLAGKWSWREPKAK